MSAAIGYIIRIANYVDAAGDEILWTTRVTPAPSGTVRPFLDKAPMISGPQLGMLESIASSGGMAWGMTTPTGSTEAAVLLRRDIVPPVGASGIVRLAAYVGPADTTITLNATGLTTPQLVYISGETMRLTNEPGPGVYDVDRAVGSLGVARTMRWTYQTDPPPLVLAQPTTPEGLRVSVHLWNGSTETLVYRGMLRTCNRTDHGLTLDIVSMVGWLREREQAVLLGEPRGGAYLATSAIDAEELRYSYYGAIRDSWVPTYARVWYGETWLVVGPVTGDDGLLGDDAEWIIGATDIVQWGVGGQAYPLNQVPPGLPTEFERDASAPSKIEALWSTPIGTPSAMLTAMLTAQWPPGQIGGMAAEDIGDLSFIDEAYGSGDLLAPYANGSDWWPLPSKDAKTLTDAIGPGLLAPMQQALTAQSDGRLIVIDWLRGLGVSESVVDAELMVGLGAVGDTTPVRLAQYLDSQGQPTVKYLSDLVSQVTGGGRTVDVRPGWLQAVTWLGDRLSSLLQVYQLSVPTITVTVTRAKAAAIGLEPGLVLGLTCRTVWNRAGLRGVVDMDGMVLSVSRRLHDSAGTYDALLALTGYTIPVERGNWGPSGVVDSVAGSTITLTMDSGDDVDDWFTAGVAVAVTDPTGLALDGTVTVASSDATSITVTGLGITPAPGDRVELATSAVAQYPDAAYLSEGQQYV